MRFNANGATVAIFVVVMVSTGCESRSPTAISDPYAGTWSGTIIDDVSGAGALKFALTAQPGGGVIGTWTATFPDAANNEGGSVSATVALMPVQFMLACLQAAARGGVVAAMTVNGNRMTGTYGAVSCNGLRRGRMEVARQ
jgi:hypothetical protein